jgi:murein DD-endopeptidase
MMHAPHTIRTIACLLASLLLAACASGPRSAARGEGDVDRIPTLGERISASALAQLGRPYLYGGNGPDAFDCSGLVRFAHAAQGIPVPRTTQEQFRAARPVPRNELAAGDLLFFRFDGPKVSHVALYTGNGRFVHAPQSGRPVESRALQDPAYLDRLVGIGRLH